MALRLPLTLQPSQKFPPGGGSAEDVYHLIATTGVYDKVIGWFINRLEFDLAV